MLHMPWCVTHVPEDPRQRQSSETQSLLKQLSAFISLKQCVSVEGGRGKRGGERDLKVILLLNSAQHRIFLKLKID